MQTGFFVLMAVGNESSQQMHDKIGGTAMTRMLNLRNILELVDDGLDNRPFAQQQLIRQVHELVFHVFAQPSDELKSLFKEQLGERSGNVAAIPKQLAAQPFDQLWHRSAIIDVARSQTARQQVAAVIDRQVQFKAEKPAHRRLAAPGIGGKDAMLTDALGITDFQRGGIDETDAGAGAIAALQVGQQRHQHPGMSATKRG